jgi:hypothetical protein
MVALQRGCRRSIVMTMQGKLSARIGDDFAGLKMMQGKPSDVTRIRISNRVSG